MTCNSLETTKEWMQLKEHSLLMKSPEKHLKHLLNNTKRLDNFSLKACEVFFDFSRQRVDEKTIKLLLNFAESRNVQKKFNAMMGGEKVNTSENRAALHTASRDFSGDQVIVDGQDVMPEISAVRKKIQVFTEKVHSNKLKGSTGKPFQHLVVAGIGGSYLGTEFVARALNHLVIKNMTIDFLSNVDIHNFGEISNRIDPQSTLFIIISKSYTTAETMANANLIYWFLDSKGLSPRDHVVTVTSKGSPGDDKSNPVLESFHMFDFIGGRYSVTSAVGGVPLSLLLGYDHFQNFLEGSSEMDLHAAGAPPEENLPLVAALISIWNNNFLSYPALGIIPYASQLSKLAPHVQQLYMESNGKSATAEGESFTTPTGVIIFGEPGTNAQHSFFQLVHQGRSIPMDFIGVVHPEYEFPGVLSRGVTNHQELWANLISQPMALALGKKSQDPGRSFSGNRPSSTILLESLSPENIGRLLSFYEAKTIYEGFLWGINPFDQFGVELGKKLATKIRNEMAKQNKDKDYQFDNLGNIEKFYVNKLLMAS